ncbi:GNAT family N-acetyltransferase [Actinoplanes sp. NPDC051411]|uniref:GNAT family N-acetyltransferase n=1 Tax=Actinoplanes sp. NPDC051411 TaxID=3155522 RepID=UPI003432DFDB
MRTSRLDLRRPVEADIDAVWRIHTDPLACAHNPGDAISTRDEAVERWQSWDAHWERNGFGYFTVRLLPHDEPLGFCGIKRMELHGKPVLNLFYRFDPAVWGGGIATEAATAVVRWAEEQRPGETLIARVRPENAASIKVAEKAGLRRAPELDAAGEDGLDWIFVNEAALPPAGGSARNNPYA